MDFLKEIFGEKALTFAELETALKDNKDVKLVNLASGDYVGKEKFTTLETERNTLKTSLEERDTQLEELKKVDPAALQAKITALQTANTTAATEHQKQLAQVKLDAAIDTRLIKEGAVDTRAVRALLDAGKISLDGENLLGMDEQLATLKENSKWAFNVQTQPRSGDRHGKPGGGTAGDTVDDEINTALFGKTE